MYSHYLSCAILAIGCTTTIASAYAQTRSVTVQSGEQLGAIAQKYLVPPASLNWRELARINKLQAPYVLRVGQVLKLPDKLVASASVSALIEQASGEVWIVKVIGQQKVAAKSGDRLTEGDRIQTMASSSAKLRLADQTAMLLSPLSEVAVDEHRYAVGRTVDAAHTGTSGFTGLLRLLQGSVEMRAATASDRAKPLRIQTPTSVVGVRGTSYRVTHDAPDDAKPLESTRVEVTEGLVSALLDERRQTEVKNGFGVLMDPAAASAPKPVPLLDAPQLSQWATVSERPIIQLAALPAESNSKPVKGYRVQVTPQTVQGAEPSSHIIFDKRYAAGEAIRIGGLSDGMWQLQVRAIDPQGIEGYNADQAITLKARPEPPLISSPLQDAKLSQTQNITLNWTQALQALGYVVELHDAAGVRKEFSVKAAQLKLDDLQPGNYRWRVATLTTHQGPWSDGQRYTIIAQPSVPKAEIDVQNKVLHLRWIDQKAASYEIEHARDVAVFGDSKQSTLYKSFKNEIGLLNLGSGAHFMRYRAIELDGFKGSWSDAMKIDIPPDWQHLLIYLGGGTKQWP